MLFPQLGPQYYDEKDQAILSRMEASYAESITILQSFWAEADTDYRFWSGDQTLWNDLYGNLPANRRRQFTFNRIRRVQQMIEGNQRRNRKSTVVIPIENGDQQTADQFTKILMHINRTESVLETISEAYRGALIGGMNLLEVWMDYRTDPVNGTIKVDNCAYNSFLIDPYFKKHDLSDCNFIWKRSFLTKRECISLLPEHAEEILGLIGSDSGTGRDGKFQYLPESYNYGMKNLLTYDQYYYRDYRTQKLIVDKETGETMEWKSEDTEKLKLFLSTYPTTSVIEQEIPTVKLAIVVQGKSFYHGPNPTGIDRYNYVPVLGYYAPEMPYFPQRVQGVVRGLRDAQYLYNRRRIIELDILESQITSGYIYKENSLVNPKDIFLSGQGKGLALKEEAQMTDVVQIQAPRIDPSMTALSELLAREVMEISGVTEENLGSATDDKPGILSMLRQGAGLTTLQSLSDQLDKSQKMLGEIMIDLIQTNYTPGKIKKILEGDEPSPQFYNKAFGKYGCAIEEGLNTTTQKQMNFAQLLQLKELGMPIPDDLMIESSTIQDKQKLVDLLKKQAESAAQAQQQQLDLQMQEAQMRIKLAESQSLANEGMGIERISRVQENKALAEERRAAAVKDDEMALLNFAKALKEIEALDLSNLDTDLAHVRQLIEMSHMLKSNERALKNPQPEQNVSAGQ